MASPARMDMVDEPALIEEQVDTGLQSLMDSYRPAYPLGTDRKDELNKHLVLFPARPLPQFDHAYGKAFEAQDLNNPQRSIYAMVLEPTQPYRQNALNDLPGVNIPYVLTLIGSGTVLCSHVGEHRMVVFIERPKGNSLVDFLKTSRMHEHRVIDHVLQPAVRALLGLRERKLSHGNISPSRFFIGEESTLGDFYTAPGGAIQHYLYEPPERSSADPAGRGEANEKSDCYALGVLAYELIYGLDRIRAIPREEFNRLSYDIGVYNVFAQNREFSDAYQDFFRGIFADNPNERWGLEQLSQWLSGKRFNMIAPSATVEASRALEFMGENYFNRRLLAYQFQRNWRETIKEIKNLRLDRWAELSLHKPEMGERLARAMRIAGDASTERHVNEMMARTIAILDPTGPIRSPTIIMRPDGFGSMLAWLVEQNNPTDLNILLGFIETDIANYWSELDTFNKGNDQQFIWRLQRAKPYLKMRAFGFGLERVLYDLNPTIPCLSELVRGYHINNTVELLKTLDALAPKLGPDTSFMDRHIAAFIGSRMEMGKEVRLLDLSTIPALADNAELIVLKILAKAQQKHDRLALVGLSTWAAMRIEKMLDEIHNRTMRRQLKQQLKRLASTGNLSDVLSAVVNREMALRDHDGFVHAIALHQINYSKIERFQNPTLIDRHAQDLGGRLSTLVASMAFFITLLFVLTDLFGM